MKKKTTKACYFSCPHTPKKKSLKIIDSKCHVLDCEKCILECNWVDGKRLRMICGCIKEVEELKKALNKFCVVCHGNKSFDHIIVKFDNFFHRNCYN